MWLGRVFGGDAHFDLAFGLVMGACAMATLAGVARIGGARAAWLFALTPLAAGAVLRSHFDLAASVVLVAALWAIATKRWALAFALLGVGTMTKLFPAVLVPVVGAWLWGRGEWRTALRGVAVFAVVVAAISAPFLGSGYLDSFRFHIDRPVQIESTPAVVLYAPRGHDRHRHDGGAGQVQVQRADRRARARGPIGVQPPRDPLDRSARVAGVAALG